MKATLIFFFIATSCLYAQVYRLNQKKVPIFELGAGVGAGIFPYYPGSKEKRKLVLPFPAFIYRGDKIRSDEEGGMRGRFFSSEKFEINTSFGFNLPFDSEDIKIRRGMKESKFIFEAGPGLIYHFIPRSKKKKFSLSASLNLRLAIETNFKKFSYKGLVFDPLIYSWTKLTPKLTLFNRVRLSWATRRYQGHFYDVANSEVTSFRPMYKSSGGFFSANLSNFLIFSLSEKISLFGGLFYENFKLAKNKKSPLHLKDSNIGTLLGFTYWFYQKY